MSPCTLGLRLPHFGIPNSELIRSGLECLTGIGTGLQNKEEIVRLAKKYIATFGPGASVAKPS